MIATTTASPDEDSADQKTAEEICKLLEETVLKYFPREDAGFDQSRPPSVPLVPHREGKRDQQRT